MSVEYFLGDITGAATYKIEDDVVYFWSFSANRSMRGTYSGWINNGADDTYVRTYPRVTISNISCLVDNCFKENRALVKEILESID